MLAGALLLLSLGFVLDASGQIWRYGLSELYADQFRQYRQIIDTGMPTALIVPDNGHRQVFSNLVRWADISLGSGDQRWGVASGLLAMLLAWAVWLFLTWREGWTRPLVQASVSLLGALALFWFGSGRMQFHGNESMQVYLVICFALLATALIGSGPALDWRRWAIALTLALAGTMSFATGVAIFAALIALAVVLRRPVREVLAASLAAAACVLAYSFLFPGGEGVRNTVSIEPWPVFLTAATWLGSAPVTGWLGLGVEGLFGATPARIAEAGVLQAAMVGSSLALRDGLGLQSALDAALPCGLLGLGLLAACCLRAWRSPTGLTRMERMGLGLALFAAALAFLVSVGRLEYFRTRPEQILADRYVMWTALFWCGLLVFAIAHVRRARAGPLIAVLSAVAALVLAWPSHQVGSGWARASARAIEARAAQAQTGILQPGWPAFADQPDLPAVVDAIAYYRRQQLAMFRTPRSRSMGARIERSQLAAARAAPALPWWQHLCQPADAGPTASPAWRIAGVIERRQDADEGVLAVDADGRVVGLGEFGYAHSGPWWARIDEAGRGFDLFMAADPHAEGPITLLLTDRSLQRIQVLSPTPCPGV